MYIILSVTLLASIIPAILLVVLIFTYQRSTLDREKISPFECGFDPNHTARIPFSTRFFLLAIIFIVFDIEIVLLIPIPLLIHINVISIMLTRVIFLFILLIGLLHE